MRCCTGRSFLIAICFLQLIATVERQVFDFLGYMWAPIIGNFLHIIYIIIGLFGAFQYRPKFLIVYAVWCLIWLGWNVFVICLYLEVGILSRESPILNIGTGNKSWWLDNGIGCTVADMLNQSTTSSMVTGTRYIPPEELVTGCILRYYYVEIIHAGVQCLFALIGFCSACYVIHIFTEEDDSSPAAQVNDEIEFIKMRYKAPSKKINRSKPYETTSFPAETEPATPEPPPRQPIVRDVVQPERRSHRNSKRTPKKSTSTPVKPPSKAPSKLSVWSKGSSQPAENNQRTANEPRKNLPWVHIAPSPHRPSTEINTSLDSESSPPAYDSHEEYHPPSNGAVRNGQYNMPPSGLSADRSRQPSPPPAEPPRRSQPPPPVEPPRPVSYKPTPPVVPPGARPGRRDDQIPPQQHQPPSVRDSQRSHSRSRTGSSGRSRAKERPPVTNAMSPPGATNRKLDYNPPAPSGRGDGRNSSHPPADRLPSYHSERQSSYTTDSPGDSYRDPLPPYPNQNNPNYVPREPPLPPPPSDLNDSYDTDLSSEKNSMPPPPPVTRPNPYYNSGYGRPQQQQQRPPAASNPLYVEANQHSRYPPTAPAAVEPNRHSRYPPMSPDTAPTPNYSNRYNLPVQNGSGRNNPRYRPQESHTSEDSVHSGNVFYRGQGASHV